MVTGKDMLVDRLFEMLYRLAGQGSKELLTKRDLMDELGCSNSPSFRAALAWAIQSGVVKQGSGYRSGRYVNTYTLTDNAISAAAADEGARNANQVPF